VGSLPRQQEEITYRGRLLDLAAQRSGQGYELPALRGTLPNGSRGLEALYETEGEIMRLILKLHDAYTCTLLALAAIGGGSLIWLTYAHKCPVDVDAFLECQAHRRDLLFTGQAIILALAVAPLVLAATYAACRELIERVKSSGA
jgi:hypothetical protein